MILGGSVIVLDEFLSAHTVEFLHAWVCFFFLSALKLQPSLPTTLMFVIRVPNLWALGPQITFQIFFFYFFIRLLSAQEKEVFTHLEFPNYYKYLYAI